MRKLALFVLLFTFQLSTSAARESPFPLEVNEQVSRQLERFLGTPQARKHLQVCLKRMKTHGPLISAQLRKQHLPQELLAIPLIESGYENIHSPQNWGSGLWMFVKPTARAYGLRINDEEDERLDVNRSTKAALRYLKANHRIFKDWRLTLMAYNMGETRLRKAIKKAGTKDAWKLIELGYEGDKGYLAKVIAAAIILQNQNLTLP